jgi:hypothetical protein
MQKYIIETAETVDDLAQQVNKRIQEGYAPQGGIALAVIRYEDRKGYTLHATTYAQAMMRWVAIEDVPAKVRP